MKKRILSVCITILVILTALPVTAFGAASGSTLKVPLRYVALGDASTIGYGMAQNAGFGVATKGAFPALIRDALNARGFNVELAQLGVDGMRTGDLRYLLDPDYRDAYSESYQSESYQEVSYKGSDLADWVESADLITCSLGTEDFGRFLLELEADPTQCKDEAIEALVTQDADEVKAGFDQMIAELLDAINQSEFGEKLTPEDRTNLEDMLKERSFATAYAYYLFCENYDKTIDRIHTLNPDAAVAVLGLRNMMKGLQFSFFEGEKQLGDPVKLGEVYEDVLIGKVNHCLQEKAAETDGVYYVETDGTERFLDEIASYSMGNTGKISQQFKDFCDVYEKDLQLKKEVSAMLPTINPILKPSGYTGAYDTAATLLQAFATETNIVIDTNALQTELLALLGTDIIEMLENKDQDVIDVLIQRIQNLDPPLKKIKDLCILYAKGSQSIYSTPDRLPAKAKAAKEGNFYEDSPRTKPYKTIYNLTLVGSMRTIMGNGFFQQPSANGHKQLKDAVLNAVKEHAVECEPFDPTCTAAGCSRTFYQKIGGTCYEDAACLHVLNKSTVTRPAKGHKFTAWSGPKTVGVCKEGTQQRTCTVCKVKETQPVLGKTKFSKVKAGKKSFKATWKKPAKTLLPYTTKYEIRYSLKSSMKKAKTVSVKGGNTVSKTIKKLKAKKKYYVQVRYVVVKNGKTYTSPWSAKKTVKTK